MNSKQILRTTAMLLVLAPTLAAAQQLEQNTAATETDTTQTAEADSSTKAESEETKTDQNSGPKDGDFKPSEEISEDFPVPLPSDI